MNTDQERTDTFRWRTRWELYEYFRDNFNLAKKDVDREIYAVMASFKPRKGLAIRTSELWQKVGLNLEKQYTLAIDVEDMEKS
jgi:hypothetical protein